MVSLPHLKLRQPAVSVLLVVAVFVSLASAGDYGEAFDRLRKLGLPDSGEAEYGRLMPADEASSYGGYDYFHQFPSFSRLPLDGNSWRLSEPDESGVFAVIQRQSEVIQATIGEGSEALPRMRWEPRELESDIEKIKEGLEGEDLLMTLKRSSDFAAELMLFATHLDGAGLEDEANEIAAKVLATGEVPEDLITATIGKVADSAYLESFQKATESGDWFAFADDIDALISRFSIGWPAREAASALAREIRSPQHERSSDRSANASKLAGSLKNLTNTQQLSSLSYYGPWIFPESQAVSLLDPESELVRQMQSGTKSVPLLLDLLDDSTFLPFAHESPEILPTELDQLVAQRSGSVTSTFKRPATPSDIAATLLFPLIPGLDSYETSRKEFAEIARDWWAEAKDQTLLDLARTYYRQGSESQQSVSILYLAEHGEEIDFPEIEEQLITTLLSSPWSDFTAAKSYLSARGEAGQGFIDRLEKETNELVERLEDSGSDQLESYQMNFSENITVLKSLISSEGASDLLSQVASGDLEISSVYESIIAKLSEESPEDQLTLLLESALAAEDPDIAVSFFQLLYYLERDPSTTPSVEVHRDYWQQLMDTEETTSDGNPFRISIAWNIETTYAPESAEALGAFWRAVGTRGADHLIDRANQILAGDSLDSLPPLPSASDVSEARADELEKEILAMSEDAEAFRSALSELTLTEQLWAVGTQRNFDNEDPVPPMQAAIEKLQFTLASIEAPDEWAVLRDHEGEQITADLMESFIKICLEKLVEGESFEFLIERESGFSPFTLTLTVAPREELIESDETESLELSANQIFSRFEREQPFLSLAFNRSRHAMTWLPPIDETGLTNRQLQAAESIQERSERFPDFMKNWLQAPAGFSQDLSLSFVGLKAFEDVEEEQE